MGTLLFKHAPYRTEGALGYLLRLAESNRLTIRDLGDVGLTYDTQWLNAHGLMPMKALDPGLWDWVCRIAALRKSHPRLWNARRGRFCPHCLVEDDSWRACWELTFYDACHEHQVWMVDTCSSCSKPLSWKRTERVRCECGSDLRIEVAREAPTEVCALSKALYQKLHECPGELVPSWLEPMALEELHRLIRYLGIRLDPNAAARSITVANLSRLEASWPISSFAASILNDWPNAFAGSISAIQDKSTRRAGLPQTFSRSYIYLYAVMREDVYDPLRQAFEGWLVENWTGAIGKRNRWLSEKLLDKINWLPGKVVAMRLGISQKRLARFVDEGVIHGYKLVAPRSHRVFLVVPRDEVDRLDVNMIHEVTLKQAAHMLGLGKIRSHELVIHLFPNATRNPTIRGQSAWRIRRIDVDEYIQLGDEAPLLSTPEEHHISLAHILKYWAWDHREVIDLIRDVMEGRGPDLLGRLGDVRGMAGWVFDNKAARAWVVAHTPERAAYLSIPAFAVLMGVTERVGYWLARNEFVKLTRQISQRGGCGAQISREDARRFDARYVFSADIAAQISVTPQKMKEVLADEGFYPVSAINNDVEKCGKTFFEKTPELIDFLSRIKVELPRRKI